MTDDLERRRTNVIRAYEDLQKKVALTYLQETFTRTDNDIAGLPARIQAIRDGGYAFANYLEGKAGLLEKQWGQIKGSAIATMQRKKDELAQDLEELQKTYNALGNSQGAIAQRQLDYLEPNIERVKQALDSAEKEVRASFGEVPNNSQQANQQLKTLEGYLKIASEATFSLHAGESIFMAVQAEWRKTGKGSQDPDGYFYITDQRVVMEQKEKVGKNFLGFGGQEKHELLWEAPLSSLMEISHENKGLLGGIDLIHITFGEGAPFGKTTIEVKGGIAAKSFAAQLQRAADGGLEAERNSQLEQAVVKVGADAPAECGVCGASFDSRLLTNRLEVRCEYCGAVTLLPA